jgi:hypothetical protein
VYAESGSPGSSSRTDRDGGARPSARAHTQSDVAAQLCWSCDAYLAALKRVGLGTAMEAATCPKRASNAAHGRAAPCGVPSGPRNTA